MSQDASPGIAKGLTTLRENSQSAQDWSPISVNLIEGVTPPVSRCFGKRVGDGAPVEQNGG